MLAQGFTSGGNPWPGTRTLRELVASSLLCHAGRLCDRPDGEAQPRGFKDRGQAAQLRIAGSGKNPIRRLSRELCALGDRRDAALGHGDVAKRQHQCPRMALFDGRLEVGGRFLGILQLLNEPALKGKARLGRAPGASPCGA